MTKLKIKKMLHTINRHTWILFTGLKCMIISTLAVGLFAFAIYGFCTVSTENGYAAVIDFGISCSTLAMALASMYYLGLPRKVKGGNK